MIPAQPSRQAPQQTHPHDDDDENSPSAIFCHHRTMVFRVRHSLDWGCLFLAVVLDADLVMLTLYTCLLCFLDAIPLNQCIIKIETVSIITNY